ncbi:MAG: UDP-N-acetylmuramoyl-tripeptide--D-alanyl-D-alanine ligase [Bacteroidia bacterium]
MEKIVQHLYSLFLSHPRISTDTRNLIPDSIFFSLSGPSFNGNKFASQAIEGGCAYAVVDQKEYVTSDKYILVEDSLKALQELSSIHRKNLSCKVIAITGSNGKTTSKELLRKVLQKKYITYATRGNLNNHIGVPLTLLELGSDVEFAIIEMGASKQGDIKELVDIAQPDFGLITNIGMAHLEGMGGIEGVIKTKTELYDFIKDKGFKLFVNTIHPIFVEKSSGIDSITYGESTNDDYRGYFISSDPFVKFKWGTKNLSENQCPLVSTNLIGKYNFENLLAAACVGSYFGVSDILINEALAEYVPDNNRSQIIKTANNELILDAYNANPTSMKAALHNFSKMKNENKVVILGQMNELGDVSNIEHKLVSELAQSLNFQSIILIGEPYSPYSAGKNIHYFPTTDLAIMFLQGESMKDQLILIKGSRSNKLERLKEVFS